jgi:UPF0716 protein FxsA
LVTTVVPATLLLMFGRLLLLFVVLPLTDLVLLLVLARYTGVPVTLGLVFLTGLAGAWMARRQWHLLLARSRIRIEQQELPAELVTDGFLILLGGCLLIAPGVLTDLAGLALMFPATRRWFRRRGAEWVRGRLQVAARQLGPEFNANTVDGTARENPTARTPEKNAGPATGRIHRG